MKFQLSSKGVCPITRYGTLIYYTLFTSSFLPLLFVSLMAFLVSTSFPLSSSSPPSSPSDSYPTRQRKNIPKIAVYVSGAAVGDLSSQLVMAFDTVLSSRIFPFFPIQSIGRPILFQC